MVSMECLEKNPAIIRKRGGDLQIYSTVDHMEQLMLESFEHGLDFHLEGITICLEN